MQKKSIVKKILSELDHQEVLMYLEEIYGSGSGHINSELTEQKIGNLTINMHSNGKIKSIDTRLVQQKYLEENLTNMYNSLSLKTKESAASFVLIPQSSNKKWIMNYEDDIILYPCDDECPRPKDQMGHYPFVLEYTFDWFDRDPKKWIWLKNYRKNNKLKECMRLLSFEYNISYNEKIEKVWAYTKDFEIDYVQKAYFCKSNKRQNFIAYDKLESRTHSIVNFFFECNKTLSSKEYNNFHRALYWYQKATEIGSITKSLEYQAFFNAIESLIEGETTVKVFIEFIDSLYGNLNEDDQKFIIEIYKKRSEITHGSFLFHKDKFGHTFSSVTYSDDRKLETIKSITKKIILLWLCRILESNKTLLNKYAYQLSISGIEIKNT